MTQTLDPDLLARVQQAASAFDQMGPRDDGQVPTIEVPGGYLEMAAPGMIRRQFVGPDGYVTRSEMFDGSGNFTGSRANERSGMNRFIGNNIDWMVPAALATMGGAALMGGGAGAAGAAGGGGSTGGGFLSGAIPTGTIAPLPVGAELAAMVPSVNMGALAGGAAGGALAAGEATGGLKFLADPLAGAPPLTGGGAPLTATGLNPINVSAGMSAIPKVATLPPLNGGINPTVKTLSDGLQLASMAGQVANPGGVGGGQQINPEFRRLFTDNIGRANAAADALAPRVVAGLDPTQTRIQELMRDSAFNNTGLNAASNALNRLGGFNATAQQVTPQQAATAPLPTAERIQAAQMAPTERAGLPFLGGPAQAQAAQMGSPALASVAGLPQAALASAASINRGDIREVQAGTFQDAALDRYMNPYIDQVVNRVGLDNERNRLLQQQQMNAQAIGRGAFGGSRQAVMEAENARNFADTQARTASSLRAQGFDTAANLVMRDKDRQMAGQIANQQADSNVALANAQMAQATALANAGARNNMALAGFGAANSMSQFNAGAMNNAAQFNAGLQQQTNLSNANAGNQFALTNFGAGVDTSRFNAGQANAMSQAQAGFNQNAALSNQNAANQFGMAGFNAANDTSRFNAGQSNAVGLQNASNSLTAQGQNLNALGGFLNGGLNLNSTLFNNAGATMGAFDVNRQLQQQQNDANRQNIIDQQQMRNSALGITSPSLGFGPMQPNQFGQALGLAGLGLAAYQAFPNAFGSIGNWLSGGR